MGVACDPMAPHTVSQAGTENPHVETQHKISPHQNPVIGELKVALLSATCLVRIAY
jgi:hypothetical protein